MLHKLPTNLIYSLNCKQYFIDFCGKGEKKFFYTPLKICNLIYALLSSFILRLEFMIIFTAKGHHFPLNIKDVKADWRKMRKMCIYYSICAWFEMVHCLHIDFVSTNFTVNVWKKDFSLFLSSATQPSQILENFHLRMWKISVKTKI